MPLIGGAGVAAQLLAKYQLYNIKTLLGCCEEYEITGYDYSDSPTTRSIAAPSASNKPKLMDGKQLPPGCTCAAKGASVRGGKGLCMKKPCAGVDCLIRAFKDAQDFVDSLGKVPGLVGLGLMDPSESPYFGRPQEDCTLPDLQKLSTNERSPTKGISQQPTISTRDYTASGNKETTGGIATIPYNPPTLPNASMSIRTPGVVREGFPTAPDLGGTTFSSKWKRKDDKKDDKSDKQKDLDSSPSIAMEINVGPCGEPKCKSRKKKPVSEVVIGGSADASESLIKIPKTKSKSKHPHVNTVSTRPNYKGTDKGKHHKGKAPITGPGGDRNNIGKTTIKVSRQVMRYVYSIGDVHPGVNFGHKTCIDPRFRVPANMGWLWNTKTTYGKLKPRVGWKPGAIGHYLNELLKVAKAGSLEDDKRPRSVPSRSKRGKVYKSMSYSSAKKSQAKKEEVEVESPPTLHIHRKDGTYYVTMYPIKKESSNRPQLEEPMKPLQFKILKNKDDASIASSSTASDMEIEFSPPAAVNRYRKQPDVIHVETQVKYNQILEAFHPVDGIKKKEKKAKKEKKVKK